MWQVTDHQIDCNRRAESISDQIWKYTWPHLMVTATVLIVLRERIRFVPVVSSGVRARSVAWGFVRSRSPNYLRSSPDDLHPKARLWRAFACVRQIKRLFTAAQALHHILSTPRAIVARDILFCRCWAKRVSPQAVTRGRCPLRSPNLLLPHQGKAAGDQSLPDQSLCPTCSVLPAE